MGGNSHDKNMKPLTPQQQRVIEHLADGRWHCMANQFFMKDDRKRISELNGSGYEIIGMKCDKSCGVNHSSRVLMRKLKRRPDGEIKPEPPVQYFIQDREGNRVRVV